MRGAEPVDEAAAGLPVSGETAAFPPSASTGNDTEFFPARRTDWRLFPAACIVTLHVLTIRRSPPASTCSNPRERRSEAIWSLSYWLTLQPSVAMEKVRMGDPNEVQWNGRE
jgi:hypothetical protein